MAITVAPLSSTVMKAVGVAHAGLASGINNAVTRVAGLIAIALMSVLLQHVFDRQLAVRLGGLRLSQELVAEVQAQRTLLAAAEPPELAGPSERVAIRDGITEAFVAGVRLVALIAAGMALGSAVIAAVTIDATPG
jgi:hypothetical protein